MYYNSETGTFEVSPSTISTEIYTTDENGNIVPGSSAGEVLEYGDDPEVYVYDEATGTYVGYLGSWDPEPENYDDSDIVFDDFDEDDEDDQAIIDKYGLEDHVYTKLERLLYVDGEVVEIDDCLEFYGLKRQHLDPDSPYLQQITIIPDWNGSNDLKML